VGSFWGAVSCRRCVASSIFFSSLSSISSAALRFCCVDFPSIRVPFFFLRSLSLFCVLSFLLRSRCILFSPLTNPLTQPQCCSFAELNLLFEGGVSVCKFVSKHARVQLFDDSSAQSSRLWGIAGPGTRELLCHLFILGYPLSPG
jgi:hypothetical protein